MVVLGDESGYTADLQPENEDRGHREHVAHGAGSGLVHHLWHSRDVQHRDVAAAIKVPWLLGLIVTRSTDQKVSGIYELVDVARGRINNGIPAYTALQALRANPNNADARVDSSMPTRPTWAMRCC